MFRDLIGKGVELTNIGLQQGYIKEDGSVSTSVDTDHSKWVTTDFIKGGRDFLLYLNSGYYIVKGGVYDSEGNFIRNYHMYYLARKYYNNTQLSFHLHKDYQMRLCIIYNSQAPTHVTVRNNLQPERDITIDENIIDQFVYVDLNYFKLMESTDPSYPDAVMRAEHICSFIDDQRYKTDNECVQGTSYTDQREVPGRVGNEKSPYTYLTCWHNPRGVVYTENIQNHVSEYGYNYTSNKVNCKLWYGLNCTNCVDFVTGSYVLYYVGDYAAGGIVGTNRVIPESDCSNLKPLDIVQNSHHVWCIVAIYLDANDRVRFIRCAESGGGDDGTAMCLYTPESLHCRLQDEEYGVYRLKKAINVRPEPELDYIPSNLNDDFTPIIYNDDVCTMLGDKAPFMWGDPIFINVKRNVGWENLVIKKWNEINEQYETFQNIDITSPVTYTTKISNGDWIDVSLNSYFPYGGTEYGKYIAYCTAHGKNIFDKTQPFLKYTSTKAYWIDATNNLIKCGSTASNHTWAIPCKPNTTYTVTQPAGDSNAVLRLAWGNMADLSFVQAGNNATCYDITNYTQVGDLFVTTITTGQDATYLFFYCGGDANYNNYLDLFILKEQTANVIESDPTYFEVLAVDFHCTYVTDTYSVFEQNILRGTNYYVEWEGNGGVSPNPGTYQAFNPERPYAIYNSRLPSSSYPNPTIRVRSEYGCALKRLDSYYTVSNLYTTEATVTQNKRLNETTGAEISATYNELIVLDNVDANSNYIIAFQRKQSSSEYRTEQYAFYDANGDLIGSVNRLYDANHIPQTNINSMWTITTPTNCKTLKIALYMDNTYKTVYKRPY